MENLPQSKGSFNDRRIQISKLPTSFTILAILLAIFGIALPLYETRKNKIEWKEYKEELNDIKKDNFNCYKVYVNKDVCYGNLECYCYANYLDCAHEIKSIEEFMEYFKEFIHVL